MTTDDRQSHNAFEPNTSATPGRDRAEAAIEDLRQQGGVFVNAVRATRMPMVLTDPGLPGNPIIFANQSFLDLSGYSMDDVKGQQPHFLNGADTDPGDMDRFRQALEQDQDIAIETVQYRKDGSRFLASVLLSAFKDENGRTLHHFLSYLDVTPRKAAEDQLAASVLHEATDREAQLRLLFGTQAVWETDAEGVIVADSPSWRAYTGQTLEEWLGSGWLDAIHPDDRASAERNWRETVAARGIVDAEFRFRAPDGRWRWTNVRAVPVPDATGRIGKWAGMNIDIDARKRAEDALVTSERRLQLALSTTGLGAYEWDLVTDQVVGDEQFKTMTALSEPLTGEQIYQGAVHPDDRDWLRADLTRAMEGASSGRFVVEHRLARRGSFGERWVLSHGQVYFAEHQGERRPVRVLGTLFDISERKRADAVARENGERQSFLLELTDAIRTLNDPLAIAEAVTARLCQRLQVNRVLYGEIADDQLTVEQDFTREVPSMVGVHSMKPFGPDYFKAYKPGAVIEVDDIKQDARLTESARAGLRERHVAAYADAVLFAESGEISLLAVHSATPRPWSDDEKSLIHDVAERVHSAIQRVRIENALSVSEERFRRFGEASQDVIWIRDAEMLQWQYLTPAFQDIYGLSREEALTGNNYRGWLDLIVPEDRTVANENIRRVHAGEHVAFEYRIRRPVDGAIRHLRDTDFPITDEKGQVKLIAGIGHDLTELRETELRMQALIEGIPQLVWRAGEPGLWTWASPQWTAFTGQSEKDSHDWGWLAPLHPDDRPLAREAWAHAVEHGGFEAEYRICSHEADIYRWFQTRATPVRDAAGAIVEWFGTSTDIHDLRSLQEHQHVLVAELQHRTRNLIAVVRSTADKTARRSGSLGEFRDAFRDRLEALARVQGLLSRLEPRDRVTFDELIQAEMAALDSAGSRVTLDGPPGIRLRSSMVQTLAMALHELATNALKYGALAQPQARLRISWALQEPGAKGEPWLRIEWKESGVRMPPADAAPTGTGQGRLLIERALPYQLGAKTDYSLGADGVHCMIEIPVSRTQLEVIDEPEE